MKRSPLLRGALLAVTMAVATTSCSFLAVPSEVGIKQVPIDLTFGGELPDQDDGSVGPPPVLPPAIVPEPTLPPAPEQPKPKPKPDLCGPTLASAVARDPAPASITSTNVQDTFPTEGTYLYSFIGNFENRQLFFDIAHKELGNIQDVGEGYSFSVADPFNGTVWWFEAQPETDTSANPGLFLQKIEIPEEPATPGGLPPRRLEFTPAAPLKVLNFPIQPGERVRSAAVDNAPKTEDPVTGGLQLPSANTITSTVDVGSREIILVCEELAQAWKVNWALQIAGEYNLDIVGSFWLATQYGGWPVKEEYTISGDLIPGNFATNLMKIDPGNYL